LRTTAEENHVRALCDDNAPLCAEAMDSIGYEGQYTGHDEPSLLFYSNTPGAGSFLAVNTVYSASPKDGTVLAIGAPTTALDEKLGTQGVRFKTAELNWVGRVDSLINIVFMWNTSKVKTFADAQTTQLVVGTGGA
jgi:hypothetical protein